MESDMERMESDVNDITWQVSPLAPSMSRCPSRARSPRDP